MEKSADNRNNKSTMKALVFHGPNAIALEDRPWPAILQATDATVRVIATTICGTDLHILKGGVPTITDGRILGHEGVGFVFPAPTLRSFKTFHRRAETASAYPGSSSPIRDLRRSAGAHACQQPYPRGYAS